MAQGYDTDPGVPSAGARTDTKTLFGPTMGLVAVTAVLFTLGAYLAIVHGVNEIFAAFSVREAGRRAERLVG